MSRAPPTSTLKRVCWATASQVAHLFRWRTRTIALEVLSGPEQGRRYVSHAPVLHLGSRSDALVSEAPTRALAVLSEVDGRFVVQSQVEAQLAGAPGRAALRDGEELTLGDVQVRFTGTASERGAFWGWLPVAYRHRRLLTALGVTALLTVLPGLVVYRLSSVGVARVHAMAPVPAAVQQATPVPTPASAPAPKPPPRRQKQNLGPGWSVRW